MRDEELVVYCDVEKRFESSKALREYSYFIDMVKFYNQLEQDVSVAIKKAIRHCINEGILEEFLIEHGSEVENMLTQEWIMEDALRVRRAEGKEEGKAEAAYRFAMAILDDFSDEVIAQKTSLSVEEVKSIRERRDGFK